MPKRIQRKRAKGWRMPDGAIYVGRPSRWGNPFQAGASYTSMNRFELEYDFSAVPSPVGHLLGCETVFFMYTHEMATDVAVLMFRHWLRHWSKKWPTEWKDYIDPLRGKDLACWCPLESKCHADVLLEVANA